MEGKKATFLAYYALVFQQRLETQPKWKKVFVQCMEKVCAVTDKRCQK